MLDWIERYRQDIQKYPVLPKTQPGEIRRELPAKPPAAGERFNKILEDFDRLIVPGMTHWNHPRFFAYFSANNSEPSILAEMITAAMGAQCMNWQTSPAATELEQVVMKWLQQMVGLPDTFTGSIQDTASTATLVALLVARERATEFRCKEEGGAALARQQLRVYASQEAHSSVEKAVMLAGFGRQNLVKIGVDEAFAMRPELLEQQIQKDIEAGFKPACVVATVGTTSSTAVDPLKAIGETCRKQKIFLHVDGAFSGCAAILPEKRWMFEGAELADSVVFNPHKWLFTNFDCTAFYVKDVDELLRTCAIEPEYLRTQYDAEVVNFRDWGLQLGRRFRALKLWFVIRSFGVEGLKAKIREGIRLAEVFRSLVEDDPAFQVLAPAPVSLVCFRYRPSGVEETELEKLNASLLERVNQSGEAYLTHTKLGGIYALRFNTSQELTTEVDIRAAWEIVRERAHALSPASWN